MGEVLVEAPIGSPIETQPLSLLAQAPFIGTKTIFSANEWREALAVPHDEPESFDRCRFVVSPQGQILSYRVDFPAAVAPISFERGFVPFILECDGKELRAAEVVDEVPDSYVEATIASQVGTETACLPGRYGIARHPESVTES